MRSTKRLLLFLAFILAGLFLYANLPIFKKFTITNESSGKIVYIRDLDLANEFYISFIHSVNRTPVEEYYKISGDKFIVYKTVFESYGAGMPEYYAGDAELIDGKIIISSLKIELSDFSIFVGTIASHKLVFENKSFQLADFSPPKSLMKFEIKRVSLLQMLFIDYN